jgi:hypothetical protein
LVASNTASRRPSFRLGQLVATPGALAALERSSETALPLLARHARADWGEVCPEDKKLNDEAVAHEGDPDRQSRVLSAYRTKQGEKLWIITEADRSSTCILLPEEY